MADDRNRPSRPRRFEVVSILEDVAKLAARVSAADDKLDRERAQLHAAMRAAYLEGIPVARVARAANMTRQRASVIVRRRK